ncbi:uncharacterized protein LOC127005685 [Eriocheir sinensis]|uniref:uncharacterized protein LOC127005685 n=1 Tax=Eriocheir sinensis TaxID=95602 RepID=UPI0021C5A320|nr:uncharacterized protein LOC127005685 [Eriocheir sinensis]XP_050730744.1 uncharacterized protein LOC127005685 [Eriocheir sinensis]XP_050730746.1 uncharacterized protein LOC127005685 [Eriocheir sinensis]XP_050730747.1 uncharacterized protein LOC127005685 [Eriocheir sinensis]
MGKNTRSGRRKKRRPGAATTPRESKAAKDDPESLSVEELLAAASTEMDAFQYEAAQTLCRTALAKEPDNVAVLETSAGLCLELGNLDGARHCLGRAITLQPERGHEKYMSMAQLMTGQEALQCYLKGIEILTRAIASLPATEKKEEEGEKKTKKEEGVEMATEEEEEEGSKIAAQGNENLSPAEAMAGSSRGDPPPPPPTLGSPVGERAGLVRQVSTAYCSVAELFMTDLCDVEEAEEECRASITKAIEADPTNPEAYQHMASFLLVKQEAEEAKQYITKSLKAWLPQYRAVREGKASAGSFDPVEVCPLPYATRLTTARILIEVEDHEAAREVLEGLAEEDDEVVDTWYLLGWNHYLQGEEQREAAHYSLHRALQVHAESPSEDAQLVEHLKELMEELGPYTEAEDEEDQGIEEELEQDSEEEDEDEEDHNAMDTS